MACSRRARLLALASLCNAQAWPHASIGKTIFGVRGGSTNALDESFLIESFQDEVLQMRRDIQQETNAVMQELRQEIMEAKERGLFETKKVSDENTMEEENEFENEELEDELLDALDEDVPPSQEEQEKIQLFEDADDDFLVGDSDEEPDSVLDRMKARVKPDDLVDVPKETEEDILQDAEDFSEQDEEAMISHLAHSDVDLEVQSNFIPKPKRKKKSKKLTQPAGPQEGPKKKKKRKSTTKRATIKEVVQTALSSKTEGDRVLVLKSPNALQALVKGIVLALLLGLAMLVLRVVEKSVTSTVTSSEK